MALASFSRESRREGVLTQLTELLHRKLLARAVRAGHQFAMQQHAIGRDAAQPLERPHQPAQHLYLLLGRSLSAAVAHEAHTDCVVVVLVEDVVAVLLLAPPATHVDQPRPTG